MVRAKASIIIISFFMAICPFFVHQIYRGNRLKAAPVLHYNDTVTQGYKLVSSYSAAPENPFDCKLNTDKIK
jgi:hypothetical protein